MILLARQLDFLLVFGIADALTAHGAVSWISHTCLLNTTEIFNIKYFHRAQIDEFFCLGTSNFFEKFDLRQQSENFARALVARIILNIVIIVWARDFTCKQQSRPVSTWRGLCQLPFDSSTRHRLFVRGATWRSKYLRRLVEHQPFVVVAGLEDSTLNGASTL